MWPPGFALRANFACVAGLGFGDLARHGFDFGDVLRVGLTVMLTGDADVGQMGVDGLAAEQHAEVFRDGAVGSRVIQDRLCKRMR